MSYWKSVRASIAVSALMGLSIFIDEVGMRTNLAQDNLPAAQEKGVSPASDLRNQDKPAEISRVKPKISRPASVSIDVTGKIENPDGSGAADAKVIAIRLRPAPTSETRQQATADERGEFSIRLSGPANSNTEFLLLALRGDASGTLNASFILPAQDDVGLRPVDQQPESILIRLEPGRLITGTVFHAVSRKPIHLAKVYSHQGQFVRTNREGHFELRGVPAGVQQLIVMGPGLVRTRVFVDVSERPHGAIDVFLAPGGTVQGRVIDQNGDPVPGAAISSASGSMILGAALTETADEEGRFLFDGFPLKTLMYPLQTSARGYYATESEMFAIRDGERPRELTLGMAAVVEKGVPAGLRLRNRLVAGDDAPPKGAIRGHVVDPTGRPVRNFAVRLLAIQHNEQRDSGSFSNRERHFSDDDGRFVIGHLDADKRYRLAVIAAGFGRTIVEPIFARTAARLTDQDEVEFRLGPPHQLQVRVIDEQTEQPIPDVMIGLLQHGVRREPFEWNYVLSTANVEWTSSTGTATFTDLAAEEGPIFIEHPGYARHQLYWKNASGSAAGIEGDRIEMALVKESRLQIRIAHQGQRDARGLHVIVTTSTGQQVYSPMALPGEPSTIDLRQLPHGKQKFILHDANAAEPWTPLTTFEVDLKQGDNVAEVDLDRIQK